MRAVLVSLVVLGCGGGAPKSSSGPPAAGPPTLVDPPSGSVAVVDCATAVNRVLDRMTPGGAVQTMVELSVKLCTDDAWSVQARACMAKTMSRADGQACIDRELTNEQRKHFGEAMLAAFGDPK